MLGDTQHAKKQRCSEGVCYDQLQSIQPAAVSTKGIKQCWTAVRRLLGRRMEVMMQEKVSASVTSRSHRSPGKLTLTPYCDLCTLWELVAAGNSMASCGSHRHCRIDKWL